MPDESALVGKCGLFCGECVMLKKKKCPGCAGNDKATWCKVRQCCTGGQRRSCAECTEYVNPKDCGNFNNFITKIFGFIFRSNRAACIQQIRDLGMEEHARIMRKQGRHTIKK